MIRKIIKIDTEKCNGCGICADACHEGAIGMVDGKATLLREDYCDGLGDCLPACPTGAISFEEREALAYDEQAVLAAKSQKTTSHSGCPGSKPISHGCPGAKAAVQTPQTAAVFQHSVPSQLRQWPVQIKLAPLQAPFYENAKLLIAADCTAYAYANFHQDFMQGRITLIGCPKLDAVDYAEKLTYIIANNNIKSVTVVRMEVPCCGGIENAVKRALMDSGKFLPWNVVTISTNGTILE